MDVAVDVADVVADVMANLVVEKKLILSRQQK